MWHSWEHQWIVILLFTELILESDNLEALSTDLASVNRSFSDKIISLFVHWRIIFNTWPHANDQSPRTVRSENQDWVINSSELRVDSALHFMPLIELNSILSNISAERSGRVTVQVITSRQLTLIIDTVRLHEALEMPVWLPHLIFNFVHEREVVTLWCLSYLDTSWYLGNLVCLLSC
jgi:hypothetical protein